MQKWIILLALLALPLAAQKITQKAFRNSLSQAVSKGKLSAEEQQRYDAAMKTLDANRASKKSGADFDRKANRQALSDLKQIAQSPNLAAADKAKLASYFQEEEKGKRKGKGKGKGKGKKKKGEPAETPKQL
jgi:hypothetical protein